MASPVPASERRAPVGLIVALSLGIAAAGGILWWRTRAASEAAPSAGPGERQAAAAPGAARATSRPELSDGAAERNRRRARVPSDLPSHEVGAKVYAAAVAAGERNPGEKAFRADALAFFEHNADLADDRAAEERITTDELKELTVLGLLAMHVRRWDAVAQVTRRELSAEERTKGDELVFSASNALKAAIRDHVAKGDAPEVRWETIRKHQASFVEKYQALARISPADYDRLLSLPFQPSAAPTPSAAPDPGAAPR